MLSDGTTAYVLFELTNRGICKLKVAKRVYGEYYLGDWILKYPECRRILEGEFRDPEYLSDVAHTKRFLERYVADPEFREKLAADPYAACAEYGLRADPDQVRVLWDHDYAVAHTKSHGTAAPASVQRYRSFIREKKVHRDKLRIEECVPVDSRFRVWRERQLHRCWTHLGPSRATAVVLTPLAVELSKGCSVGCWFCGLGAGGKEADFEYTPENASLWQDVLRVLKRRVGPAASTGVCYWATDPLDNPDYEKFCVDYANILGRFPQTTTAQPQKYIERVRDLLRLSRKMAGVIERFSILNLKMFDVVHEQFTPEELLFTELITQNMGSTTMLSSSGRARGAEGLKKKARSVKGKVDVDAPGTIACLAGVLMNMVERSVKLIAPCPSDDKWFEGYWVFEEGCFENADDFEKLLAGMIERHMSPTLSATDPVAFRPDFVFEEIEDGFTLKSYFTTSKVSGLPCGREVGRLVAEGSHSAGEIAIAVEDSEGLDAAITFNTLNNLFHQGFLNEEPGFFDVKKDI